MCVGFEPLSCGMTTDTTGGIVAALFVSGSCVSTSGATTRPLLGDRRLAQLSATFTVGVVCEGRGLSATARSFERSYRLAGSSAVGVKSD
jgi:hypothetical protein